MNKETRILFSNLFLTIYTFFSTWLYGWQIVAFLSVYGSLQESLIAERLSQNQNLNLIIIIVTGLITGIYFLFSYFSIFQKSSKFLDGQLKRQSGFILILILNYLLFETGNHLHIVELILFFLSIYMLNYIGKVFYRTQNFAWFHPTTQSMFYVSGLLQGMAWLLIMQIFKFSDNSFLYWILALLFMDLLILYARFKFLAGTNKATNLIARQLFGKYGLYFGLRIVVGIFIPAVYILFNLFVDMVPLAGVGVFLLTAAFIDRFLFLHTASEVMEN